MHISQTIINKDFEVAKRVLTSDKTVVHEIMLKLNIIDANFLKG